MRNGLILAALLAVGFAVQWAEKNTGQAAGPSVEVAAAENAIPYQDYVELTTRAKRDAELRESAKKIWPDGEPVKTGRNYRIYVQDCDLAAETCQRYWVLRSQWDAFPWQPATHKYTVLKTEWIDSQTAASRDVSILHNCVPCGTNCGCDPCTCPPASRSPSGTAVACGGVACSSRPAGGPLTRVASHVAAVRPLRRFGGALGRVLFWRR